MSADDEPRMFDRFCFQDFMNISVEIEINPSHQIQKSQTQNCLWRFNFTMCHVMECHAKCKKGYQLTWNK